MAAQVVREERERVERRYARLTRLVAFELAQQLEAARHLQLQPGRAVRAAEHEHDAARDHEERGVLAHRREAGEGAQRADLDGAVEVDLWSFEYQNEFREGVKRFSRTWARSLHDHVTAVNTWTEMATKTFSDTLQGSI